jgi:hypothetical protein
MKRWAQFDPGGISGTKLTSDNSTVFSRVALGFTKIYMRMEAITQITSNIAIFFIVLSLRWSMDSPLQAPVKLN